jgi:hypothetical protein
MRAEAPVLFGPLERIQWFKLALSKGLNRVGVSPLTWGQKQVQFPKLYILQFLEYRTLDEVQKPNNSECYAPSLEQFRI